MQLINHSFKKNSVKLEMKSQITLQVVQSCSQSAPSASSGGTLLSGFNSEGKINVTFGVSLFFWGGGGGGKGAVTFAILRYQACVSALTCKQD